MMKTRTLCCAAGLLLLAGCRSEQPVRPKELRCENLTDPLAIDSARPHFSWKTDAGGDFRQSGYEIRVAADSTELLGEGAGLWNSGRVASGASVLVPYEGRPLASPSLAYWKVRVWDDAGRVSAWSAIRRFGVGILEPSGWTGDWIGLPGTECPLLRRRFEAADTERKHLLHVASLGYHEVYVNGRKVSDRVLAPAVSELGKRALSVTYDITSLLAEGRNEVVVWLGPGWYRRDTFRDASTDGPFVNVRLDEIAPEGPRTLLVSDTSWQGGESGYMPTPSATWRPLAFGGECVDGSRVPADLTPETLDGRTWRPVATARLSGLKISPQMCEPNVVRDTLRPRSLRRIADSVWVADMGREFNGWIELRMTGLKKGQRIAIDYSDWTNDDGSYRPQENNSNFEDLYIASGEGTEVFRNRFDHHAFQYLRIRGLAEEPAMLAGYAIQGGYADASTFECSDTDLNAIYDMVEYTLRNLAFGGYVVDCPHLERMGYGGDGNASCRTFQTLFDAAPLYMNWLQMWADCIRDDGGMPHNVPNPYPAGGGPYWCGFLITASWQTYLNYGDFRPVERYYPVMQRWLEYVDRYTVDGLLGRWPDTDYRGWYLGDWLAPEGVDYTAQESVDLVSNCYLCECLDALSKMAALLGREEEAARYGERLQALRTRIGEEFYDPETARYATGSQIDQIYPMLGRGHGLRGGSEGHAAAFPRDAGAARRTHRLRTGRRDRAHRLGHPRGTGRLRLLDAPQARRTGLSGHDRPRSHHHVGTLGRRPQPDTQLLQRHRRMVRAGVGRYPPRRTGPGLPAYPIPSADARGHTVGPGDQRDALRHGRDRLGNRRRPLRGRHRRPGQQHRHLLPAGRSAHLRTGRPDDGDSGRQGSARSRTAYARLRNRTRQPLTETPARTAAFPIRRGP